MTPVQTIKRVQHKCSYFLWGPKQEWEIASFTAMIDDFSTNL
ncbi:hypothetical protein ACJIZ3_005228 [Penstemon smallii]|uniref:Uncharacterized protein n=1 Tax=Penstemon smallii TaxID=265156 RepID=A0ABD3S4B4_9LAMI